MSRKDKTNLLSRSRYRCRVLFCDSAARKTKRKRERERSTYIMKTQRAFKRDQVTRAAQNEKVAMILARAVVSGRCCNVFAMRISRGNEGGKQKFSRKNNSSQENYRACAFFIRRNGKNTLCEKKKNKVGSVRAYMREKTSSASLCAFKILIEPYISLPRLFW